VNDNPARFRVVDDGWKGLLSYYEPNSFWADSLRRLSPDAKELREIDFDMKFKNLQRSFQYDEGARGNDCLTYYRDLLRDWPPRLSWYAQGGFESMAPGCESQRAEYIRRRAALLTEFPDVSATTKLRAIDPTEIVIEVDTSC
jgi:hypothetical protein